MANPEKPETAVYSVPGSRTPAIERLPRIELRQLRYFLAVAEELNFTRAAARIGIAQPPLSQQIIALEAQLGAQLFVRSRRAVSLTREGEAFVSYARRIINATQTAAEVIQSISRGEDGPLSIGAIFSSIYLVAPVLLPAFSSRFPRVRLQLQEMTISQQIAALKEEQIDIGILRGPINVPGFDTLKLLEEPFVAVVPSSSPLAKSKNLTVKEIAAHPLIRVYPSANRDYSRLMFASLIDAGHKLDIVQEVMDTHTLIGLVAAGFGISMVPASLRNIHIDGISYVDIDGAMPTTTLQLAWRSDSPSPILRHFVEAAAEFAPSLGKGKS
ncbi:MAG: LysR substrate-binding domain-containing protein [Flavobacteriaceae bacterium]